MTPDQQLTPYLFPETSAPIRVVEVNGDPWFVAADVCEALGVRQRDIMSALDEDEKMSDTVAESIIDLMSESGVYSTIFRSRKPEAVAFKRWITHEVLPQIRRTGGYSRLTPAEQLLYQAQRLVEYERRQIELDRQQRELERQQIETRLRVLEQASRLQLTEARLDSIEHVPDHLTILAWCKLHEVSTTATVAAAMGKAATALYRQRHEVEPPRVRDERFGLVNLYPVTLLEELFSQVG